ncbi:ornithine cyclodeaminase family protein [Acrocarpospora macrocephala]|uniref:ornithine cyclodeaminase family protein n=1 Tax=Acrocarpospora macrocephala TaxID=150177 RepID=UPI001478BD5B|nr:ornithine cyclodeaminase family protein [Acrocarpospora macrocephala]
MPWPKVIDALEQAVPAAFGAGQFFDRFAIPTIGGELLVMPAAGENAVGVKLVGVGAENGRHGLPRVQALYVLFDARNLSPLAILDGTSLTTLRTAGQSAMIVRRLAPQNARHLIVFGSGPQARAHVEAICSVRPIESVRIVGRRPEPVAVLCAQLSSDRLDVRAGTPDDVPTADVVVCATTSPTPVFDGKSLGEHVCVVAVGSHTPDASELDHTVFSRASLVLVEHRQTALREAGDIIKALAADVLQAGEIRDFGDLAAGQVHPVAGISIYKSVGMSYQDLAVVEEALQTAVSR